MLNCIEFMHANKIIHRDIKPDNFLVGYGNNSNKIFIVDFGLAKKYVSNNLHLPYKDGKSLTGTARYASIHNHLGNQINYKVLRSWAIEERRFRIFYLCSDLLDKGKAAMARVKS